MKHLNKRKLSIERSLNKEIAAIQTLRLTKELERSEIAEFRQIEAILLKAEADILHHTPPRPEPEPDVTLSLNHVEAKIVEHAVTELCARRDIEIDTGSPANAILTKLAAAKQAIA